MYQLSRILQWVMRLEEICQKLITQQASSPDLFSAEIIF
jgi:hypothetical protein